VRILALETTELIGSVAAMEGRNLLAELKLSRQQRTARSLAPGVRSLLGQVRWQPTDVELVAVTIGPGSFTGLRIGVTTAKVFAYAAEADILGIDTLETIAAGAPERVQAVTTVVDAQRGEAVVRPFARDERGWFRPVTAAELVEVDGWLERLPAGTTITGPVLRKLADRVPHRVTVLDRPCWPPRAATVARLAARDYEAGRRNDVFTLAPHYSRRSAAEETWDARNCRR